MVIADVQSNLGLSGVVILFRWVASRRHLSICVIQVFGMYMAISMISSTVAIAGTSLSSAKNRYSGIVIIEKQGMPPKKQVRVSP